MHSVFAFIALQFPRDWITIFSCHRQASEKPRNDKLITKRARKLQTVISPSPKRSLTWLASSMPWLIHHSTRNCPSSAIYLPHSGWQINITSINRKLSSHSCCRRTFHGPLRKPLQTTTAKRSQKYFFFTHSARRSEHFNPAYIWLYCH